MKKIDLKENIDGYKVGDLFYTSWGYEQKLHSELYSEV